jgi:hypothetical protein
MNETPFVRLVHDAFHIKTKRSRNEDDEYLAATLFVPEIVVGEEVLKYMKGLAGFHVWTVTKIDEGECDTLARFLPNVPRRDGMYVVFWTVEDYVICMHKEGFEYNAIVDVLGHAVPFSEDMTCENGESCQHHLDRQTFLRKKPDYYVYPDIARHVQAITVCQRCNDMLENTPKGERFFRQLRNFIER